VSEANHFTMSRLTNRVDQLGRPEIYRYDKQGNVTNYVDRRGVSVQFKYDLLERRTGIVYGAESNVQLMYDKVGRITNIVDSIAGNIKLSYDSLDRLTQEVNNNGTVSYGYNDVGLRTNMTVSGTGVSPVAYFYDAANRLTNVVQGTTSASLFYDDAGRRTKLTLPNGVNVLYAYDTASRLTNITYQAAVTNQIAYRYDQVGNRVAQSSQLSVFSLPSLVSTSSYNAANQQLVFGSYNLLYDAAGNVTNIVSGTSTNRLYWNARNQLTNVAAAVSAAFVYDGLGRRVARTVSAVQEKYLYDGLDTILTKDSTGSVVTRYFRGLAIDEPWQRIDVASKAQNNTNRVYLADALGSIVALTDSSKAIQTEYDYQPFGATTTTGQSNRNSYKFTAREDDGTGLMYYRARYYHPGLGRFVSEDPIEYFGGDINLYGYVFSDPINGYDPIGWMAWYDRWIENAASFGAGFGDNVTFGITRWTRNQFDFYNGTVNPCSGWYTAGEWTGVAAMTTVGAWGGLKAAGAKGAGMEFSHWIPNRFGGARSLWNGNYVTTVEHALSDPYRYRFMPRAWKLHNPLPSIIEQQWNRIPYAWKGTAAGAIYSSGSAAQNGCGCN
jgi:RHS repeat-associated protein